MPRARILEAYCKGCGLCVSVCANECIQLADEVNEDGVRVAVVRQDAECKGCGLCYLMCPDAAIIVSGGKA